MAAVWFIAGMMVGGLAAVVLLCCLWLGRVNDYEREIHRLRSRDR